MRSRIGVGNESTPAPDRSLKRNGRGVMGVTVKDLPGYKDLWAEEREGKKAFEDFRAGFQTSRKGNPWRKYRCPDGMEVTLTIFAKDGGYAFCLAGAGGDKLYSPGTYPDQKTAFTVLWLSVRDEGSNQQ